MVERVGSNIINQLGSGSGIDTQNIVDQLVELERLPEDRRLDRREERIEAQISGLGLLRSAVDDLESAMTPLANADTFDAKQASISDTSLMAVNSLSPEAVPGNYRIKVEQVAQSQSLASGTYASLDSAVGEGSLTIRFGDWASDLSTFTADADATGATIEIDQSNNSLSGLRDAINDADIGVQASIVGQEGSYQLLLTGPTGATRELEITATEGASPGLANFDFNETTQNFTQQQEGLDAIVRVNGLQVTRNSNVITDVIEGVEFELFNSSATEEISINVTEDRSLAEDAIRDFVEAYNTFYTETNRLISRDEGEDGKGSLSNDPLAGNMLRTIRSMIGSAMPGIDSDFNSLATIGIRTKIDGTLEIADEGEATDFDAAISNNFEQVRNLFVPNTESSDSRINVTAFGSRTQPGSYAVEITQEATKGFLNADPVAVAFPLDTTGKDYSFALKVDGKQSATIALPDGKTYASGAELAEDFQTLINADSTLKDGFAKVNVTFNTGTGALEFQSDSYGAASNVEFTQVGVDMADLGVAVGAGTAGQDVAGTVDGETAFGFGNVLRPAIGSPAEGLSMTIAPGATTGTVGFSRGLGGMLTGIVDSYVRNSGLISQRETNLKEDKSDIADAREALDRRSEAFRARQEAQFRAMEQIVRSLNSTGDFLEGINDRLPFTAPPR